MKKLGIYKGHEVIQRGRTRLRFEARIGGKSQVSYTSLDELYASIDRRERRIQLILSDPRL
jgi:hypothetical protein